MPCCSRPPARWWHIFFSPGPSECWCRACRRELAPGPYGGSDPDQAEPWVRGCCQDGWLAKGWCCRWCGRDEDSGRQGAARGIYGGRANYRESGLESLYCACGLKFPYTKWNYASCRSCYWVLTRQLVRRFLKVFGPWTQIHDSIFLFLIETRFNHEDPSTDVLYRADGLAEVRQHGLRLGSASSLPGVLRRRVVGMEGQRCFAMRYRMGDVDWIPYTEALGPDPRSEHILVWHPPMEAPPRGALARVADELARAAKHPLAPAISSRRARALWVLEQKDTAYRQGPLQLYPAPCVWCGHFTVSSCDGVPATSTSRGWWCEFRVCYLCQRLYERCRFCCRWTGLPGRAGADAIERCQGSAVVLGPIAKEYVRTGRFPHNWLPLWEPLWRDPGQKPPSVARWRSAALRRALCEDPPAERGWQPWGPADTESDTESILA